MRTLGHGVDIALALLGAVAWSFAVFVLGSRFLSPTAGGLLAVAMLVSALAIGASSFYTEARAARLAAGLCPRCGSRVASEHRHRRWDATRSVWDTPVLAWECGCGFNHSETWACPSCPPKT